MKRTCSLGDGRPVHLFGMCVSCARAYNKWWSAARVTGRTFNADVIAWAARRALKLAAARDYWDRETPKRSQW